MGWFISLALIIAYFIDRDTALLHASGLFAIAGSIDSVYNAIKESGKYIKIPVNTKKGP